MWPSAGLLNGPFIFTMASLIYESLQIVYLPFPPQANDAEKPHGATHSYHLYGKMLPYIPSQPGLLTWPQEDCQQWFVPGRPWADKLGFILKLHSKVFKE